MPVENKHLFVTAAVTVVIAIGAGHLMQYGLTPNAAELNNPPPRPSSLRPSRPQSNSSTILMQGASEEGSMSRILEGGMDELEMPDSLELTSMGAE